MTSGVYLRTEKIREVLRKAHKSHTGEFVKGYKQSPLTIQKRVEKMIGKKRSKLSIKHISESKEGVKNPMFGIRGEKSSNWRGGITPINRMIRQSIEHRLWREAVFARDNWTCQKTGTKGGKLVAHHIQNFAQYPKLRFAINNGITLSKDAHIEFHKIYGRKNNNKEQLNIYVLGIKL